MVTQDWVTELKVGMEALSPLYIGDAFQKAELRPPSLKGGLRFWYRAIDGAYGDRAIVKRGGGDVELGCSWEDKCFGGTRDGAGQSPFLLRASPEPASHYVWDARSMVSFGQGRGATARNGIVYLGYPFHMDAQNNERNMGHFSGRSGKARQALPAGRTPKAGDQRTAIPPGHTFEMKLVFTEKPDERLRRAILASIWLLGHVGSLGSRSRRGFGGISLLDWATNGGNWPEMDQLPLLSHCKSVDDWNMGLEKALFLFTSWFKSFSGDERHPHIGGQFRWVLLREGSQAPFLDGGWEEALNRAGQYFQDFRQRKEPDYGQVKAHVMAVKGTGGRPLRQAPERAVFGLPLSFRFSSIPGGRSVTIVPFDVEKKRTLERHGSLLHIRLVRIADKIHPLFVRLDGAVPGLDPPAAIRGQGRPLISPEKNVMDEFMDSLENGR